MSDGFQACPVCHGHGVLSYPSGVVYGQTFTSTSTGPWECHHCKGMKVVSVFTGMPLLTNSPDMEMNDGREEL